MAPYFDTVMHGYHCNKMNNLKGSFRGWSENCGKTVSQLISAKEKIKWVTIAIGVGNHSHRRSLGNCLSILIISVRIHTE